MEQREWWVMGVDDEGHVARMKYASAEKLHRAIAGMKGMRFDRKILFAGHIRLKPKQD